MGLFCLNRFYYYNSDFSYAFYTRGLNIQAQFNSKSYPIPYGLEVGSYNLLADGVPDPNTTRGMGLVPVNPLTATSVVGHSPDIDDEFVVTHLIGAGRQKDRRPDDRKTD